MPTEDFEVIVASGTADVSAAQVFAGSNAAPQTNVPLVDADEALPQFRDKILRIMDDQIFVVDRGSPPGPPATR
jgi:hypothetical protein